MKKAEQEYPHLQYCVESKIETEGPGLCKFNALRTFLCVLTRERTQKKELKKTVEMHSSVTLGIAHAREESKILREVCLFRC